MLPRIWIAEPGPFTRAGHDALATAFEVVPAPPTDPRLEHALLHADAIWMHLAHRVTRAIIEAAAAQGPLRCRFLAVPATGTDHLDAAACRAHGIEIVSLRGETAFLRDVRATAEHTMGLLLALVRHLPAAHASVEGGRFDRHPFKGRELYGQTLGLVGVGRLGRIVARYARAFDLRVLGYDPYATFDDVAEPVASLAELAARSDIVSVHAALTPETTGLLDAAFFARMRPGAYFVNTARGPIVDEAALIAALESGALAGAALDVIAGEPGPTPATSPALAALPRLGGRLLITPHIGGNTKESLEKAETFLARKLIARVVAQP